MANTTNKAILPRSLTGPPFRRFAPTLRPQIATLNLMKAIINKIVYLSGVVTLLFVFYASSFFLIKDNIVRPYEIENSFEPHTLRILYNPIYYPIRWFVANGMSFKPEEIKIYYGVHEKPWSTRDESDIRSAKLNTPDDKIMSIGFTGNESVLESFDKIKYDSYVKLTFGVALSKDSDRFINRLIGSEIINLMEDPRIPDEEFTKDKSQRVQDTLNRLKGEERECANKFITDYQDVVLEHCLQAGYAQNIGGGCYHVVGYSISTTVITHALSSCNIEI